MASYRSDTARVADICFVPKCSGASAPIGCSRRGAGGGAQVRRVQYIGRPAAASPATASLAIHRAETAELIDAALTVD